jgi:hypothetical protein
LVELVRVLILDYDCNCCLHFDFKFCLAAEREREREREREAIASNSIIRCWFPLCYDYKFIGISCPKYVLISGR